MSAPVRFTVEESQKASDDWGFNCGPGALCAVLNLTPNELRPLMGDFERKRYTNPTLMFQVLERASARYRRVFRGDQPTEFPKIQHGLVRVQWGGPWLKAGVPPMARYRKTHWVAMRAASAEVFDVNAMCVGGWIAFRKWHDQLVPWLCGDCVPKWDGTFWPTHAIEVARAD